VWRSSTSSPASSRPPSQRALPKRLRLTRDGRRLVTANFGDDSITVIDTQAQQPIATWHVDTVSASSCIPTKPIAYSMASFDNQVTVLNYDSGKVVDDVGARRVPHPQRHLSRRSLPLRRQPALPQCGEDRHGNHQAAERSRSASRRQVSGGAPGTVAVRR
jgi:hypothetical protein